MTSGPFTVGWDTRRRAVAVSVILHRHPGQKARLALPWTSPRTFFRTRRGGDACAQPGTPGRGRLTPGHMQGSFRQKRAATQLVTSPALRSRT
jgi:hypothetical protein